MRSADILSTYAKAGPESATTENTDTNGEHGKPFLCAPHGGLCSVKSVAALHGLCGHGVLEVSCLRVFVVAFPAIASAMLRAERLRLRLLEVRTRVRKPEQRPNLRPEDLRVAGFREVGIAARGKRRLPRVGHRRHRH